MAKTAPAKPVVEEINLRGKMGAEIAKLIAEGQITQELAEQFVAERAVNKLRKLQA